MKNKILLQLGAGPLMVHSIKKIKELSIKVYAIDRNPNAPGFKFADGFKPIDLIDEKGVLNYAKEIKADAIMAVNEFGVISAAKACKALGLIGLDPEVALKCLDKGLMRECWGKAKLPQPKFIVVENTADIPKAVKAIKYPAVLKPAMNCGSRGVSVIHDSSELKFGIEFAKNNCRNNRYVVEEFIEGTEMTIEGLAQDGVPTILGWSDKEAQRHTNFLVAMALNYPAKFSQKKLKLVEKVVKGAAIALGIKNGAIHCEVLVNEKGVYLVEMGGRPGGGHIFGQVAEATSGVCMPQELAKILLGEKADVKPKYQKGACYKFFSPPNGLFIKAHGEDKAKKLPNILDFGFEMKPKTIIGPISGDADRPGFVVSSGRTREEAIKNANKAISMMRYKIEPIK